MPSNMLYSKMLDCIFTLYGDESARSKANEIRETIRDKAGQGLFFIDNAVANEKAWAMQEDGSHFSLSWASRTAVTPGWTDLESMTRQVCESVRAGEYGWYAHNAVFQYDHGAAMQKLSQPNLILINSGDGIAHLAQRAHEMCPHFDYVEMEGGTHDIVDEQPEAWAKAVAAYLKG